MVTAQLRHGFRLGKKNPRITYITKSTLGHIEDKILLKIKKYKIYKMRIGTYYFSLSEPYRTDRVPAVDRKPK
jgi:hypothetical protein